MRHRILLTASFLYLAIANVIWIARDTRPPFWDMAYHQSSALRIYDAFATTGIGAVWSLPYLTGFYPPFYQSTVAVFYAMFGRTNDAAQMANLPAIAILLIATYGLGRTLLSPMAAALAAAIVNFYPILLWLSRETIIDYWLTGMVALAMWLMVLTREFSDRGKSAAFGVVCGLGMLTKHTFPLFIALPFIWLARKNPRNAAVAAGIAVLIASVWYVPAAPQLAEFLKVNTAGGASEGDPARLSFQAFIFYLRALEGYQLFLPLFILFGAGAVLLARNFDRKWIPVILWIAGGWLGLMLFLNKDPRYSAPLLPAVALVTAQVFDRKLLWIAVLVPFLIFQHYLVSFGIASLPEVVVLAKGREGPLSWHWNLYRQNYFDLWGRPAREDWPIRNVLERISEPDGTPVRLGMIPDIPRFDPLSFEYYIALWRFPVTVNRLWKFDPTLIANNDYIIVDEKAQNPINTYVFSHPESFHVVEWFPLPNGAVIRLYKVGNS
jgi:4-amino-4-deoxy-L-arabinose transferase-like glycosyltransferase